MGKKHLSKELRTAIEAVDALKGRDCEEWSSMQGNWRAISDLVTLWGFVVPRGWPSASGTAEQIRARDEAEYKAERDEHRRLRGGGP
jgi:hypothetical protein